MDKLAADMIQCRKDGFGCHYGKWKALQPSVFVKREPKKKIDDVSKKCENCGSEFISYRKGKRFCCESCAQTNWYKRKAEERMENNG